MVFRKFKDFLDSFKGEIYNGNRMNSHSVWEEDGFIGGDLPVCSLGIGGCFKDLG